MMMASAMAPMKNAQLRQGSARSAFYLFALMIMLLLPASAANAHPHVWVSVKTEVLYSPDHTVTGFRHHWTFDEFYTSFAIQGLDKDEDGTFSREELAELADVNISALKEFDYFTFPKLGEEKLARAEPGKDYWLEHKDGQLTLHFTLPLEKPANAAGKKFSFAVYDPTFYISFNFAEKAPAVTLAADAPKDCKVAVVTPKEEDEQTASLGEAFFNNASDALNVATQLAQDAVVTCEGK